MAPPSPSVPAPTPRGKIIPLNKPKPRPEPGKFTTKDNVLGGAALLLLGLVGLAFGVWLPIHLARTHPGEPGQFPLRVVLAAPILVLGSIAVFAGKGGNKTILTVLACIGLGLGFLLCWYIRSVTAGSVGVP